MTVAVAFLATSAFAQTRKPAEKIATVTRISGAIVKADAAGLTLKVKGKDETFVINASTKITAGAKIIAAADLKAGGNATVTYTKAGETMTATKVAVATPKPVANKGQKPVEKPVEKKK